MALALVKPSTRAAENPPAEAQAAQRLQSAFIWTQADPPKEQEYAVFRKTFELAGTPSQAAFRIFADVRYLLWINGDYVERGPCRFSTPRPEFDTLDVGRHLKAGRNVIAVLVHYPGYVVTRDKSPEDLTREGIRSQCARMKAHRPGLTAELELTLGDRKRTLLATDATWRCTTETRHLPSPPAYGSIGDVIDARRDAGDWHRLDCDDRSWKAAVPLAGSEWAQLRPRSIPLLRDEVVTNLTLVGAKPKPVESGPLATVLPLELAAGSELVIDCGRMLQAYVSLDFEAESGNRLELYTATAFYDTGRMPASGRSVNNPRRKPAPAGPNRYIALAGRQTYLTTDTFGFKYLVLRVPEGRIKLHGIRVVDRLYPFQRLGRFASNDRALDRIWDIGVRTVEVCSEDAHVDCADAERAQWMADGFMAGYPVSRVTLAGPGEGGQPRYADGRLLRNMLRHMGDSQLPDGRLQPMQPAEYPVQARHGVIDDYSMLWVQAVAELYRRDGDLEMARDLWPTLVKTVDYYLNRRTERGLVYADEFVYFANPLTYVSCEGATVNAYFHRSLLDAAEVAQALGEGATARRFANAAQELRAAYHRVLWDENAGTYRAAVIAPQPPVPAPTPPHFNRPSTMPVDGDHRTMPTGHAALMALYFDMVPPERIERVRAFMKSRFPTRLNDEAAAEKPYPYTAYFLLETLLRQDTTAGDLEALQTIRKFWTHMTGYETGVTSENWQSGSFVHEAGAPPSYFLSSYVLGVRTDGPREARRLFVDPRLGDLLHAEGTTLTEFGPVSVRWNIDDKRALAFEIENATKVDAVVSLRLSKANTSLSMNGHPLLRDGKPVAPNVSVNNGRVRFHLSSGKHSGQLEY